jgi:hypothetical protein
MKRALVLCASLVMACGGASPAPPKPAKLPAPPLRVHIWPSLIPAPILFPEERRSLEDAAARFLSNTGGLGAELGSSERSPHRETVRFVAAPAAEVDRVMDAARLGERLATGEACSVPVPGFKLLERAFADKAIAQAEIECKQDEATQTEPCTLFLRVYRPRGGKDGGHEALAFWSAPLGPRPTLQKALIGMEHLSPMPVPEGESFGGATFESHFSDHGPSTGVLLDPDFEPPWVPDFDGASTRFFDPIETALDACLVERQGNDDTDNPILIGVGADGHLDHCEPKYLDQLPTPGMDCICRALSGFRFDRGAPDRRALLTVTHTPHDVTTPDGRYVVGASLDSLEAPDESLLWAGSGVDEVALARCLAKLPPRDDVLRAKARLQVTARGEVQSAAIEGLDGMDAAMRACAISVLKEGRFACAQAGAAAEVTAELDVRFTRVPSGAP